MAVPKLYGGDKYALRLSKDKLFELVVACVGRRDIPKPDMYAP